MIVSVCVLLLSVAPPTPVALRGVDDVPQIDGTEFTAGGLWSIVEDARHDVVTRSRAVRLLPTHVSVEERAVFDARLAALLSLPSTPGVLAYDVALARFDLAVRVSGLAAQGVALEAETARVPSVRQAAALMWWRVGGEPGRAALQRCVHRERAASVRATCIGRLRAPVSTPVTGAVTDVLHETSDGDSSTSPGRQLRRTADLPQQR
jgi:hypothetical protein